MPKKIDIPNSKTIGASSNPLSTDGGYFLAFFIRGNFAPLLSNELNLGHGWQFGPYQLTVERSIFLCNPIGRTIIPCLAITIPLSSKCYPFIFPRTQL